MEGSVGKIATAIIARLRNESFSSLSGINSAIRDILNEYNNAPFQKRPGSRAIVFENEEKPYMGELPLVPYEVCEWSYGHQVHENSHIWFNKGQYSVPYRYIGETVDVKYNSFYVYVYHNRNEIARHEILSESAVIKRRTNDEHLPLPLKKYQTVEDLMKEASDIGKHTKAVFEKMFENAKVKDQPALDAIALLALARDYPVDAIEKACEKALVNHMLPTYKDVKDLIRSPKKKRDTKISHKTEGIIRGADYYKTEDKT